jgi:hypothetical protein
LDKKEYFMIDFEKEEPDLGLATEGMDVRTFELGGAVSLSYSLTYTSF